MMISKKLSCSRQKPRNSPHKDLFSALFVPFYLSSKILRDVKKVQSIEIILVYNSHMKMKICEK